MLIATLAFEEPGADAPAVADVALPPRPEECHARATLYRLLAGVFVEEASPQFLAALREADSLRALAAAGLRFDDDFLQVDALALGDALACEYATLFASCGSFPPVESVRLTGRFKQEPHFQIARLYQRMGFEQVQGRFAVFPDQLGVELMFAAELLERCAAALERDDRAGFVQIDKELRRFWTLHLGRWVRGYAELVSRAAGHSFYREMARFLRGFAQEEIEAMGLVRLDDLDRGRLEVPKAEIKLEFDPDEPVCGECPPQRAEHGGEQAARVIPIAPLRDLKL